MKNRKKRLALLLAGTILAGMLAGCGSSTATVEEESQQTEAAAQTEEAAQTEAAQTESSQPADAQETPSEQPAEQAEASEITLPLSEEPVTFTAFSTSNPNMSGFDDWSTYPIWAELAERTNINFDWTLASFDTASEQYNLLVVATSLPDIVNGDYYSAGVAASVEQDVYWDLAPYLEEYAPNYYNVIQQDGIRQEIYSDDGYVVCLAEIAEEEFPPNNGILFRQDLLDEQGLELPVTYDEYIDVLTQLKTAYDMEAPFFMSDMNYLVFSAGYGVNDDFCLDENDQLVYGPITDNYKAYLKTMNEMYEKGLIYQDFYAIPNGQVGTYQIEHMAKSESAASFMYCEFAGLIDFGDNTSAVLVPGYIPRQNKDDQIHLTEGIDAQVKTSTGWFISTNCAEDKMELACQLVNYLYSDEGALLANYGIEGVTYEVQDDGSLWYTDEIMNNPDMTQTQALIYNLMYMQPCRADYTKYNISTLTTWKDFADVWASADNDYKLPTLSLTAEEEEVYSAANSDVETYMDEVIIKFIIGDMDIDAEWDTYLQTMESLGVQDMIDTYNAAYTRYQNK